MDIKVNLKTGAAEALVNGKYISTESLPLTAVIAMREQLICYRGTTPNPELLEWEIRIYEFIIAHQNPEHMAEQWMQASKKNRDKKLRIKELGWEIP